MLNCILSSSDMNKLEVGESSRAGISDFFFLFLGGVQKPERCSAGKSLCSCSKLGRGAADI